MIAGVLIEYNNKTLDKTFDYLVPFSMEKNIKVGHKVRIPFGKNIVEGFVLKLHNLKEEIDYKEIIEIVNEEFVLNEELLELGKYLKEETYASLISCYQVMLPKALKAKNKYSINIKYDEYISLVDKEFDIDTYINNNKRNTSEAKILLGLKEKNKILKKDYSLSSIKSLINKGIIKIIKEEKNRLNLEGKNNKKITLTKKQNEIYEEIIKYKKHNTFLIHGVTGSGKTEIYIKVIENVLKSNHKAILLVPEISLTPQIVDRFVSVFSSDVAVLHSRLSEGEKYDEYRRILKGEVNIVVGARSAVFAPLKNLGVIIVDEEHSASYKQENTPKYSAIDAAIFRGKYNDIPVILGSATPSLESFTRAKKGVYKLLSLNERVNKNMPEVIIVDKTKEKSNGILSNTLINKIKDRLNKREQVMLLLNRRGYNTFLTCKTCGFTYTCPNCDISLTHHKTNNTLRCHYCNYVIYYNKKCPNCKEGEITSLGLGTEKLEEVVSNIFKDARVLRMDNDSTSKKGAHEKIINDFYQNKYDILVGTQMISKGLNFPNVTLVGILNADASLNIPDFRSGERTFELLTQTAGRSGRHEKKGEVVIETYNPEHYIFESVKNNDYLGFAIKEATMRKKLKYPPFYFITNIKIVSFNYEVASAESIKVLNFLKNNLSKDYIILGPTTASVFKLNNKYRFSIIIKYKDNKLLKKALNELNEIYKTNKVNIEIDNNPLTLI